MARRKLLRVVDTGEILADDSPKIGSIEGDLKQLGDMCLLRLRGSIDLKRALWVSWSDDAPKLGSLLIEADELIHGDRAAQYGGVHENFGRWSSLCKAMNIHLEPKEIALVMVLGKLAREVNKHKRDNAMDAAGYLGLYDELLGGE